MAAKREQFDVDTIRMTGTLSTDALVCMFAAVVQARNQLLRLGVSTDTHEEILQWVTRAIEDAKRRDIHSRINNIPA